MEKKERVIYVGKQMRKDKDFSKELEKLFNIVVNEFIKTNELDMDFDILSIKRDAVYVINKSIIHPNIGEHIAFVPKNNYSSFIFIKAYEFYRGEILDVKGVSDEILPLHENGILSFVNDILEIASQYNMNQKKIQTYLSDYVKAYKNKELPYDHYREFGREVFKYVMFNNIMEINDIDEELLSSIDISKNYIDIILPAIQIICN